MVDNQKFLELQDMGKWLMKKLKMKIYKMLGAKI